VRGAPAAAAAGTGAAGAYDEDVVVCKTPGGLLLCGGPVF
jgi:hypothetical protein